MTPAESGWRSESATRLLISRVEVTRGVRISTSHCGFSFSFLHEKTATRQSEKISRRQLLIFIVRFSKKQKIMTGSASTSIFICTIHLMRHEYPK
jgi:hypothetical protein